MKTVFQALALVSIFAGNVEARNVATPSPVSWQFTPEKQLNLTLKATTHTPTDPPVAWASANLPVDAIALPEDFDGTWLMQRIGQIGGGWPQDNSGHIKMYAAIGEDEFYLVEVVYNLI